MLRRQDLAIEVNAVHAAKLSLCIIEDVLQLREALHQAPDGARYTGRLHFDVVVIASVTPQISREQNSHLANPLVKVRYSIMRARVSYAYSSRSPICVSIATWPPMMGTSA